MGEAAWIAEAIDQLLGGTSLHALDSGRADGHGYEGIGRLWPVDKVAERALELIG